MLKKAKRKGNLKFLIFRKIPEPTISNLFIDTFEF
jgi:hypothetical protein